MEKKIIIQGKHNCDKINKIKNPIRSDAINNPLNEEYYNYNNQIEILNKMFLNENNDDVIHKLLNTKINGYKHQDIEKQILQSEKLINLDNLIEKLVISKLKCYYCKEKILLCYKNVREKKQWTLDRIDNDYGHNHDNVVISCLECNLKRRCIDMNKYKESKKFRYIKKI